MENVYAFASRKTVEGEAREWLIRLDGDDEPSQRDIAALHEWVDRSPAHREELLRICAFWDDANILSELAIPLHNKAQSRVQVSRRFFSDLLTPLLAFNRASAVAVVCLLGITIALTSWRFPQSNTATNGVYATAKGELQVQTLADGSLIQINTDSQLKVDFSDTVRAVRLMRGEAHFDVTRDPDRPFEVYAGKGMVKAVGTAFSVRLSQDYIKVTVSEGRVDLAAIVEDPIETQAELSASEARPGAPSAHGRSGPTLRKIGSLGHGQSATFSNQAIRAEYSDSADSGSNIVPEISTLAEQELARQLSWREGYLVFAGDPLSYVVDEVNRYTSITIEIADPTLNQLRIGGRFKVGELEAMLDVLETSFGIQVSRLDDRHIQLLPAQQ